MSRVVGVYPSPGGDEMHPQPPPTARDSAGCFAGCRVLGCEVTECRETRATWKQPAQTWYWERRP